MFLIYNHKIHGCGSLLMYLSTTIGWGCKNEWQYSKKNICNNIKCVLKDDSVIVDKYGTLINSCKQ